MRRLARQTTITCDDLILPLFVVGGRGRFEEIPAMPGVPRVSADRLPEIVSTLTIPAVLLFGVPDPQDKDKTGSSAVRDEGIVPSAVRQIKQVRPDLAIITDVCLCAYTSHGHCGILTDCKEVDNDRTLELLAKMAELHAAAGADMVAPSAMMDGQVSAIRSGLDGAGMVDTAIMSYSVKFASSCFYKCRWDS